MRDFKGAPEVRIWGISASARPLAINSLSGHYPTLSFALLKRKTGKKSEQLNKSSTLQYVAHE